MIQIAVLCLLSTVLAKNVIPLKNHEQLHKRSVENDAVQKATFMDKIVGGSEARPGEIPWQASMKTWMLINNRWKFDHYCGATIISEYWLLSAAHCFNDTPKWKWRVTVGELSFTTDDQDEQVFEVEGIYNHELYNDEDNDYDVALVKIKPKLDGRGIKFSEMVEEACIPVYGNVGCGASLVVSGWGGLKKRPSPEDQESPEVLQKAVVPLIDQATCELAYPGAITDRMFCAGFFNGTIDSCQGDSGGPLVYKTEKEFVLLGIVSWGEGCAKPTKPGVYARVSKFYDWIEKTTSLHSDNAAQLVGSCEQF